MGVLCFPHFGVIRVAVARGIVPSAWSERTVEWAVDQQGRIWLHVPTMPPRDVSEKLAYLGVFFQKEPPSLKFCRSRCWAAILPLERCHQVSDPQTVLICIPAAKMTELVRSHFFWGSGFRIIDIDFLSRVVWGMLSSVSPRLLEMGQFRTGFCAYVEQAPMRWVEWGYRHPLIEHIPPPRQGIYVIDVSRKVRHLKVRSDVRLASAIPGEPRGFAKIPQSILHVQRINHVMSLPLCWSAIVEEKRDPALWYIPKEMVTQFWQQCHQIDQGTLSRVEVACIQTASLHGLLVWDKLGSTAIAFQWSSGVTAYAADADIPLLFWPVGWQWRPLLGAAERKRLTGVRENVITWVEKCSDGTCRCHHVAVEEFRPISSQVEYIISPLIPMRVLSEDREDETLSWTVRDSDPHEFSGEKERASAPLARTSPSTGRVTSPMVQPAQPPRRGVTFWNRVRTVIWAYLRSLLQAIGQKWRRRAEIADNQRASSCSLEGASVSEGGNEVAAILVPRRDVRAPEVASWWTEGSLRQRELCQAVLSVEETGSTAHLAECWAELARWQQSSGRFQDAAVCWLMAAWESRADGLVRWSEPWWLVELRLAGVSAESVYDPVFWRERQDDALSGRLAAAFLVRLAVEDKGRENVPRLMPLLIPLLEKYAGEISLRAVWLAACAASQLCGGDTLLLARWTDRLIQRLTQHGHALDLDIPSFLRFVGSSDSDHLSTVCTWLTRQRHQMLGWVMRHPVGLLRAEGLDGEIAVTGQIASQMWAWGLAAVGERRRAAVWSTNVEGSSEGLDQETTGALQCVVAAIRWRMQEVWEGRSTQPLLPSDWWIQRQSLSPLARYAVDRLCEHSRILDPFRLSRPLRSWELAPLRGEDPLGERLAVLLERTDIEGVASEAEELLRLCEQSGDSQRTCRILVGLCERAALFPAALLGRILKLVPVAWEALSAGWPDGGESRIVRLTYLRRDEVRCRMLENLARAGLRWPESLAAPFLAELWRQWQSYLPAVIPLMAGVIPVLAHVFRRFRLQRELEELAEICGQGQFLESSRPWEWRLAAAMVWAALEETDRSDPVFDAARDYLFLPASGISAQSSDREYAQVAYGYATALAFLSPRRRLGRYEELFQRLRPLPVQGSTNRFWTLQPLRFVDIVVRGAIGEVYRLSPQIQRWLAAEDIRFRQRVFQDLQHYLQAEREKKISPES
jgi:hypothetical protein